MVSVAQTLVQAVLPKDLWLADRQLEVPWPIWGLPELLQLDNAAEFHSRRWFVALRSTASGLITGLLKDLETDQGPAGHSYVFCYTPIALKPIAELIEALQPVIEGDSIASLVLAQKLQGHFRLLGPQGFTGIAMAAGTFWQSRLDCHSPDFSAAKKNRFRLTISSAWLVRTGRHKKQPNRSSWVSGA